MQSLSDCCIDQAKLPPLNAPLILNRRHSPKDDQQEALFVDTLNRPSLAQNFEHIPSKNRFTVVVTHLKSKSNQRCSDYNDCDKGQGAYNRTRARAAEALVKWFTSDLTTFKPPDIVILGDFNAYRREDPIKILETHGYSLALPDGSYSYNFRGEAGSLDTALLSASFLSKLIHAQTWPINADEPPLLDYNTENKTADQITRLFAPSPFRSSDHDPVILDFSFRE